MHFWGWLVEYTCLNECPLASARIKSRYRYAHPGSTTPVMGTKFITKFSTGTRVGSTVDLYSRRDLPQSEVYTAVHPGTAVDLNLDLQRCTHLAMCVHTHG